MRDFIGHIEAEVSKTAFGHAAGPAFGHAAGPVVIADMEAGLEHLSIGSLQYIDILVVVVQPTAKTLMTADRAHKLALELGIPRVAFVGNRVRSSADRDQLEAFAAERDCELLVTIGEDDAVRQADALAMCVLDSAPESEIVRGVIRLADELEGRYLTAVGAVQAP